MNVFRSRQLFEEAQKTIPGGVNSPVRAFQSVGSQPLFIKRGEGSRIFDEDDNSFIDCVCSWGPLILGHANPDVVAAICSAAGDGTSFGAPTENEVRLAQMIVDAVPSIDMVRLVNSGTEAVMSAIRLARGYTGRSKIIKFEGCYHGHSDAMLAKAGSGLATFGLPDSAGVPANITSDTIVLPYNDITSVAEALDAVGEFVAAIIVEPVAGNMGIVLPKPEFLADLRTLADENSVVLIFDEVITGFRISYGGAQEFYSVKPDLTTLVKIIGGGLPLGAYGGKREIMEYVAPAGPVYQAGTLSGNPIAVAAGIATLRAIKQQDFYSNLQTKADELANGITAAAAECGVSVQVNNIGSLMTVFFSNQPVWNYTSAKTADTAKYARFFKEMLQRGIYLAPSQFEAAFVSSAHTANDIKETISAAKESFAVLASEF